MSRRKRPRIPLAAYRYKILKDAVYERDKGICQQCRCDTRFAPVKLGGRHSHEIHHVIRRCRGGQNEFSNLQVVCIKCHDRLTSEMRAEMAHERRFNPNTNCDQRTEKRSRPARVPQRAKNGNNTMGLLGQYQPESKFLKADDLHEGEAIYTVKQVIETTFNDGRKAPALLFFETTKEFGLNQTNMQKLAELFGQWDTESNKMDVGVEQLLNQRVALYRSSTKNPQGATVPCIRIRAPREEQAKPAPLPPTNRPVAPEPSDADKMQGNAKAETVKSQKAAVRGMAASAMNRTQMKVIADGIKKEAMEYDVELEKVDYDNFDAWCEESKKAIVTKQEEAFDD